MKAFTTAQLHCATVLSAIAFATTAVAVLHTAPWRSAVDMAHTEQRWHAGQALTGLVEQRSALGAPVAKAWPLTTWWVAAATA